MKRTPDTAATTPPATISHSTISLRGQLLTDIAVHHARTPDARINLAFNGILMTIYSCDAAQSLLEAFAATRGHLNHIPADIPAGAASPHDLAVTTTLAIQWTRRTHYAVVPQTGLNKLRSTQVPWIDLYTGPITWQIRDQTALLSAIDNLSQVHKTAIAVFRDGPDHAADPTNSDYRAA